jgi:putative ABC transport system permease protein
LVACEVALAVVLLVVVGMFGKSFANVQAVTPGFDPAHVLSARLALPARRFDSRDAIVGFQRNLEQRLLSLPTVTHAGAITLLPLSGLLSRVPFTVEGRAIERERVPTAQFRLASAGYFETMRIPLVRGRVLDSHDIAGAPRAVVVNESYAKRRFPKGDAIGQRLHFGPDDGQWYTVVGVVGDVRQMGLDAPVKAEAYFPYQQVDGYPWFAPRDLVVRTSGNPTDWAAAVTAGVHSVDPDQPVSNVRSLDMILDENSSRPRLTAALLGVFAGLALLLAAVGIYGLLASFVADRVPEIGLRFALGAEARDIARLIIGKGLLLTVTGAALGVLIAAMVARLLTSQLYGVSDRDPTVSFVAAAVVLAVAAAASYLPARRAARMDPAVALRAE